ncbi:hypothetical protein CAI21_10455 [Alkalilimnicola ehrlichii]|uniref:PPM-type phosphatase domain-containing protein n=1 Tax=Alkalilimnicola ehrlichii TaxID=351052 RepID=A0A3E0WV91_9GAMM|nr:protein phosphatase 2C domain-containing protein [Alkalilimnicola ehrlichii]RFA29181.1 hypothetical protein CAI21_10455 [Alkalilimnicola ehrlichii]RFA36093.1 hypothetical protein CAL65_11600 [Alkalilimnicola ehrlichii]
MPRFEVYGETDVGCVKRRNEDALDYVLRPDREALLAVVADGVGGLPGGDVASEVAVRAVIEHGREALLELESAPDEEALRSMLLTAVKVANSAVQKCQLQSPELKSMATTIVVALAVGERVMVAHVGDSRCYRQRAGQLLCLTEDHTVAQQMLKDGVLSRSRIAESPYNQVLSQALGVADRIDVTVSQDSLQAGDVWLLCSDGLNKALSDELIVDELNAAAGLVDASRTLIRAANAKGGEDNITVLLFAPAIQ